MVPSLIEHQQPRFIAVRHDRRILVLEKPHGELYEYSEPDKPSPRFIAEAMLPDIPMTTRYTLRARALHLPVGKCSMYMPNDWTDVECSTWLRTHEPILRICFALRFPHNNW
jgi:hypothetical protein